MAVQRDYAGLIKSMNMPIHSQYAACSMARYACNFAGEWHFRKLLTISKRDESRNAGVAAISRKAMGAAERGEYRETWKAANLPIIRSLSSRMEPSLGSKVFQKTKVTPRS